LACRRAQNWEREGYDHEEKERKIRHPIGKGKGRGAARRIERGRILEKNGSPSKEKRDQKQVSRKMTPPNRWPTRKTKKRRKDEEKKQKEKRKAFH